MQLDTATKAKYEIEAPELLSAVDTGEAEWIMRRDPNTDYCVKFEGGLCGIHKQYGTPFLGDACHFYPRVTRRLGDITLMTAALSCPEVARLSLFEDTIEPFDALVVDRVPFSLKDYLPDGLPAEHALVIHQQILRLALDQTLSPERILLRLYNISHSLARISLESWPTAIGFYWNQADTRLPEPFIKYEDPFNLLHALFGLMAAAKKTTRPGLEQCLREMEQALDVQLNRETLSIMTTANSLNAQQLMAGRWNREWAPALKPLLHRWIAMQLSIGLFPFAGFGGNMAERALIIAVRFATLKLALMSACSLQNQLPPEADILRIVQSLARFLDHLADPTLSLAIYKEAGWTDEARLRALLGDE